ncbi:hypothetical protein MMC26_007480 [Xylographa opegraphella]|nr:hypothetical protein [Xylographa opegraphella]
MSIYMYCEPGSVRAENVLPDINHAHNASIEMFWNPSRGITFAASSHSTSRTLSQKFALSTTASNFVQGSIRDKSRRPSDFSSAIKAASGRARVPGHVQHRCLSTGALFLPDLPIVSATPDYGLGRFFGDDVPRRKFIPKKLNSTSNRKEMPPLTSAKKTADNTRHSSAQVVNFKVFSESRQPLNKHIRPAGQGAKREKTSEASRASVQHYTTPDNDAGEPGIQPARVSAEHSTALKNVLKNGMPAFRPIVVYPEEPTHTVGVAAQLPVSAKLTYCETLILDERIDGNGSFTTFEAIGPSTVDGYVHSPFPYTPRSVLKGMAAHAELEPVHHAVLEKERLAHRKGLGVLENKDGTLFCYVKRPFLNPEKQYRKLRELFRPSDRGWVTIETSLEEAGQYPYNHGALQHVVHEIRTLKIEYQVLTHEYRKLRRFRHSLDQYSVLSAAKKYVLLRDIREDITNALIAQCKQGYELLSRCFVHFRYLRKERHQFTRRLTEWPWTILEEYPSPFSRELALSAQGSYRRFCFVYHCPTHNDLYRAAMRVRNIKRGLSEILSSWKDVQNVWKDFWVDFGYTMNKNSPSFERMLESRVIRQEFLRNGLWDYEEVCIRLSKYDPLAVLRQNPAIVPAMGRMLKETDQSQPKQECSAVSNTSTTTSVRAGDEATVSELACERRLAINTSFDTCMNDHGKPVSTVISNFGSLISVTPPTVSFDASPNHASSWSSGQTVIGKSDIETFPDQAENPSHDDDQRNTQPLHKPLSYKIPESKLKEAMLASQSTAPAYWQYTLYENLAGEKVKVYYCKSKQMAEVVAKLFLDQEVIGFDVEWRPNAQSSDGIRRNVSLIQLASEERVALFHIARFSQADTLADLLAPTLKAIMEDPKISKVGVSVKSDCTRLRKYMGIEARGLFELSHLYKLIKYSAHDTGKIDKRLVALAKQVEDHLQLPLYKGDVRWSDWSQPLNVDQLQYAASDSYAGLQLYDVMEGKRKALEPTPPRPEHAELDLPILETASNANIPLHGIKEMDRDSLHGSIEDIVQIKVGEKLGSAKPYQIVKAEDWVNERRSNVPVSTKSQTGLAVLRAYYLWHHLALEVPDITSLLTDLVLSKLVVARFILEAIKIEDLP